MIIKTHESILDFNSQAWNALLDNDYPFMRYEFLAALENNNCTGEKFGWLPKHIAAYDHNRLIGVLPNYEKNNSYGEFVFDNAWAEAYQRHGFLYYPKWVVAAPYTPATGTRILVAEDADWQKVASALVDASVSNMPDTISSLHYLFTNTVETELLESKGFMKRTGCQFHWHNRNYRDFDDFLAQLTAKKRKNIRQERRYAERANVEIEIISGDQANEEQLMAVDTFYRKTFDEKWGTATLNLGFFKQVAHTMGPQLLLIMAKRDQQYIAGAICFIGNNTLYGRHWGCIEEHDHLHFEICFYQGIEYCIKNGLQYFEPGAQGEHKISRGFMPVKTYSAHWIRHPDFSLAIQHFLQDENAGMTQYFSMMTSRSPYK